MTRPDASNVEQNDCKLCKFHTIFDIQSRFSQYEESMIFVVFFEKTGGWDE